MGTRTADHLDAIAHLPDGATLVIHQVTWDEYEGLLEDLSDRPNLRVSYDRGRLEIMSPTPEHELDPPARRRSMDAGLPSPLDGGASTELTR